MDDCYLKHAINGQTIENPERIRTLSGIVRERYKKTCIIIPGQRATPDYIEAVHSAFYLEQLRHYITSSNPYSYDRDTYLMEDSLVTAELAAGGCLSLADRIMAKEILYGFALVRPPGHHAEPGRGMGFCILNHISITARYLQQTYGLKRILILDFDVHHGNGTQEVFYDTDEVLFVSVHQHDIFPFTGRAEETGRESGKGYTINLPVFSQFGDGEYTYLLGHVLQNVVEQYLPQIILVSAGYDGHRDDGISGVRLSTEWYGTITAMLKQYAHDACEGRLLMVLEGGYNPASLQESVLSTIDSLLTEKKERIGIYFSERAHQILKDHPAHAYWTF